MKHVERTPLESIQKMVLFENTKKLLLSQIVEKEQPDIVLTGTFYNPRTWKPVCPAKSNGVVLFADPYCTYTTLAWNDGSDAVTMLVPPGGDCDKRNYIANGLAVYKGEAYKLTGHDDTGGRRGRVACGITKSGEWLTYGCTDGSADAITPEDLRDELAEMDLETAIILDGGGKVNVYVKHAGVMMEGRDTSQNLILIWLKKEDGMNKKIVCLDAGHDASNSANRSPDRTYYEHEFTLDMAKRIKSVLESAGVTVVETRPDEKAVSLEDRCKIEKASGADLFLSLHSNAASAAEGWSNAKGWKAIVYGLNGARYNAAKAIYARVKSVCPAFRNPAIDAGPSYYVLKNTKAPAVLIEHGFHTNKEDTALLKDPAYRHKLAYAEAAGILDWLGIAAPEFVPEKTESDLAVEWITSNGIADGDMDTPLTAKQLAVILYRYDQQKN